MAQVSSSTDYLGGFQYLGGVLQYFPTAEGYVNVTDGKAFDYVYNYTDHLGNIRLSYTRDGDATKILEENHYYPFGMKHSNYAGEKYEHIVSSEGSGFVVIGQVERRGYQYKYNGKEYQDELSLNLYDYGARNYDPAIGRWMNIDPLAETSRRFSPYTYALNNPIRFIDPDGMEADDVIVRGSPENQSAFLNNINKDSKTQFGINQESGQLYITNPDVKVEGEFATQMESAINSSNTATLDLVDSSDSVLIDSFVTGEVDMGDMTSGTAETFKDNTLHIVNERIAIPDYDKNKGNVSANDFARAHQAGIDGEVKYIKELYPTKNISFQGEGFDNSSLSTNGGNSSINYNFNFGDVSLNFQLKVIPTPGTGVPTATNIVQNNQFQIKR